jgi:hypothetical protein
MTQIFASDPIAQLWAAARQWCAEALTALGGPAGVAQAIAREAYVAARRRIALLEAFVLKLLLIEAARIPIQHPLPGRRAASGPGPTHTIARKPAAVAACAATPAATPRRSAEPCAPEDPDRPETWRVRFHTHLASASHAPERTGLAPVTTQRRVAPANTDTAPAKAHALARRFEALRRILANPHRAVAAFARKLAALGARAYAVARRIALAAPRQGGGPVFADASVRAVDVSAHWAPDTS